MPVHLLTNRIVVLENSEFRVTFDHLTVPNGIVGWFDDSGNHHRLGFWYVEDQPKAVWTLNVFLDFIRYGILHHNEGAFGGFVETNIPHEARHDLKASVFDWLWCCVSNMERLVRCWRGYCLNVGHSWEERLGLNWAAWMWSIVMILRFRQREASWRLYRPNYAFFDIGKDVGWMLTIWRPIQWSGPCTGSFQ